MNAPDLQSTVETVTRPASVRGGNAKGLAVWTLFLILCFHRPLYELLSFAWNSDLYSHILLIPFISAYLMRFSKTDPLARGCAPSLASALLPLVLGTALVGGYWWAKRLGWRPPAVDYLAVMTGGFLCMFAGGAALFLSPASMRRAAFPLAFLIFAVPFPTGLREWVEAFLQHRSADMAQALFELAEMPVLREGTRFQLPGFVLEVAPECSGIHSTLVLFICSLLAGYVLLRSDWRRAVLTLCVIPLALLRNGFRVFVIGQLCVNVSPDMINSYIHRRGGPIFFLLSLVPFFLVLFLLRKSEARSGVRTTPTKTEQTVL